MIILPSSAGIYRPASAGTFNPNSVANRLFWLSQGVGMLDASNNPVTTSGTTVTTWQDQTGNGNHFTGSATYLDATNAGNSNGQGVISHNNTSDYFARTSFGLSSDFTAFIVQKPTSTIGLPFYDGAFYIGAYDNSSSLSNHNVSGTVLYRQNGLQAGNLARNDLYQVNYNKFKLITIQGTGVTEYSLSNQLRFWDYSGYRQGGQTAEIFWVSRAVTGTELTNIENYFMQKYSITAPYTSLPVSGAALWLDGSRLDTLFTTDTGSTNVTTNAGAIGRWEDLSGNARHATQATAGSRPTWVAPASGRNGYGVVGFNGSNQWMSHGYSFASSFTIFIVYKNNDTTNGSVLLGRSTGTNHYLYAQSNLRMQMETTTTDDSRTNNTSYDYGTIKYNNPNMTVYSGSNSGTTANIGNQSFLADRIGYYSNAIYLMDGTIAEIIVYSSALSDSDRSTTLTYLKSKWGF